MDIQLAGTFKVRRDGYPSKDGAKTYLQLEEITGDYPVPVSLTVTGSFLLRRGDVFRIVAPCTLKYYPARDNRPANYSFETELGSMTFSRVKVTYQDVK